MILSILAKKCFWCGTTHFYIYPVFFRLLYWSLNLQVKRSSHESLSRALPINIAKTSFTNKNAWLALTVNGYTIHKRNTRQGQTSLMLTKELYIFKAATAQPLHNSGGFEFDYRQRQTDLLTHRLSNRVLSSSVLINICNIYTFTFVTDCQSWSVYVSLFLICWSETRFLRSCIWIAIQCVLLLFFRFCTKINSRRSKFDI